MYKIGEFSKLVEISVTTLRYYDECGVLQPKYIDDFTGYRYYTDENILECKLIKLLKSVNFSLEEISNYRECLNQEVIEEKQKEISDEIKLLKLKYEKLQIINDELKKRNIDKIVSLNELDETQDELVLRRKINERKTFRKCA